MVPGGTAIQAIGMARLGLSVALVSPRGIDAGGRFIAEVLDAEGVRWVGRDVPATPTTAVLSTPDGAAMATATDHAEPAAAEVSAAAPSLVVLSLGRADFRPAGIRACFVSGSIEVEARIRPPEPTGAEDVVILNEDEGRALTGEGPEGAARALARGRSTAVVTMGADGAVGARGDRLARAGGPEVEVADATGAGDLFVAAFVWADLRGLDLDDALAWSCLYATLSVRAPTALDGALGLEDLLRNGRSRGLSPP
jgi:sugar/nucleoside kinase (ribokinase family)